MAFSPQAARGVGPDWSKTIGLIPPCVPPWLVEHIIGLSQLADGISPITWIAAERWPSHHRVQDVFRRLWERALCFPLDVRLLLVIILWPWCGSALGCSQHWGAELRHKQTRPWMLYCWPTGSGPQRSPPCFTLSYYVSQQSPLLFNLVCAESPIPCNLKSPYCFVEIIIFDVTFSWVTEKLQGNTSNAHRRNCMSLNERSLCFFSTNIGQEWEVDRPRKGLEATERLGFRILI